MLTVAITTRWTRVSPRLETSVKIRMHSSRMRTIRSSSHISGGLYLVPGGVPGPGGSTWSRGCTWTWGVYLVPGGAPGPGGMYLLSGVYLVLGGGVPGPRGCTWSQGGCTLVCGQVYACKSITFATLVQVRSPPVDKVHTPVDLVT